MQIILAPVTPRRQRLKSGAAQQLVEDFITRARRYLPIELRSFDTEADLLAFAARTTGRTTPHLILLDSRGQSLSSEDIAATLGRLRDTGVQQLLLGIGPADGWSPAARTRANLTLSLGAITLPHELALAVLAEQTYRALTILAGHPYHAGH